MGEGGGPTQNEQPLFYDITSTVKLIKTFLKVFYHRTIFNELDFFDLIIILHWKANVTFEHFNPFRSGKEGSPTQNHGEFCPGDLHTIWILCAIFQPNKIFFPQMVFFSGWFETQVTSHRSVVTGHP